MCRIVSNSFGGIRIEKNEYLQRIIRFKTIKRDIILKICRIKCKYWGC
jgi:hypothetical protein